MVRNWGLQPTALSLNELRSSSSNLLKPPGDSAPADSLTEMSWKTLTQTHPAKTPLNCWPTKTEKINVCWFKPVSCGVTCYIVMNKYRISVNVFSSQDLRQRGTVLEELHIRRITCTGTWFKWWHPGFWADDIQGWDFQAALGGIRVFCLWEEYHGSKYVPRFFNIPFKRQSLIPLYLRARWT